MSEQDYLLQSPSDRYGCLDFQVSGEEYVPRCEDPVPWPVFLEAVERKLAGKTLPVSHRAAFLHGTSLGGSRPKVLIYDDTDQCPYMVKFSLSGDVFPYVKAEYVATRMATHLGMAAASVKLWQAGDRWALASKRFDRWKNAEGAWQRKGVLSVLTILELDEMLVPYASYEDLTHMVRQRFARPREQLRKLFRRLVWNVLCGNTDDHARNHGAFWDGKTLEFTPAYDICPQLRVGGEASHAMKIFKGSGGSSLQLVLQSASLYTSQWQRPGKRCCVS